MKAMISLIKYLFLFSVMGAIYMTIEVLWRGYSHFSMFILAGVSGVSIGRINEDLPKETPVWLQALLGTVIILYGEFLFGCVLNLWLGLDIWDYSDVPFNLLGQICLPFALLWAALSVGIILLDDYLRYWFFHEEKPHYCWKFKPGSHSTTR